MWFVFKLSVFWFTLPILASGSKPVVTTTLGVIEGVYETTYSGRMYSAFYSVPYAEPPIGNLRFEDPQPIKPWEGTWVANQNETYCAQLLHVDQPVQGLYQGVEDCLYLQVYVPHENPGQHKPLDVLVYIHGGAFMFGGSLFAGPKFIMDRDIVFVSINYRVGIMGFLSTEDEVLPGNLGMKDQVLALKWVNNNIQSFGGDPKSITLIGLSAGAASVHFHYLSPLSKGLFHRGISQSGNALAPWALQKKALEKTRYIGSDVGCNQANTRKLVNCLKSRPVKQLVETTMLLRPWLFNPFSPLSLVVEHHGKNRFLPEHPYLLLRNGNIYDVPWINSVTDHEGLYPGAVLRYRDDLLSDLDKRWPELAPHLLHYNHTLPKNKMEEVSNIIRTAYLEDQPFTQDNFYQLIDILSDRLFVLSSEKATLLQAKSNKSPIYFYYFSCIRDTLLSLTYLFTGKNQYEGVCHGDDYMYIFSLPLVSIQKLTDTDQKMQTFLLDILTTFARSGRVPQSASWKPVAKDGRTLLQLNIKSPFDVNVENALERDRHREMWKNLPLEEDEQLFSNVLKDEL